jgi:hypothetical protein
LRGLLIIGEEKETGDKRIDVDKRKKRESTRR